MKKMIVALCLTFVISCPSVYAAFEKVVIAHRSAITFEELLKIFLFQAAEVLQS